MWQCLKCETNNTGDKCTLCGTLKPVYRKEEYTKPKYTTIDDPALKKVSKYVTVFALTIAFLVITLVVLCILLFVNNYNNVRTSSISETQITVPSPAIKNPAYAYYSDDDLGFMIKYPTHFEESYTDEPDCRKYYCLPDNTASMYVKAAYNSSNITPSQMKSDFKTSCGGECTYEAGGDSWFAASGINGQHYYYAYYKFEDGKYRGFEFFFDGEENLSVYSDYIEEIYASFSKK